MKKLKFGANADIVVAVLVQLFGELLWLKGRVGKSKIKTKKFIGSIPCPTKHLTKIRYLAFITCPVRMARKFYLILLFKL
jgi:hypothetical protein